VLIGAGSGDVASLTNGFISNARVVKGTALYTANFTPPSAPLTDVTNTKLLCCQSNTSAIAAAVTPGTITANGNASATNFNPFTDDINAVMGQETGYATLNPLMTNGTLTDGNLTHPGSSEGNSTSSIKVSSGKWYAEVILDTAGHLAFGWTYADSAATGWIGANAAYYIAYNSGTTLQLLPGGSSTLTSGTGTIERLIPWQMCIDADNNKAYLGDGSTWYNDDWNQTGSPGNPLTGENPTFTLPSGKEWYFFIYANLNGASKIWTNFGQKPFKYAPPEGFQPLNYANLPSPGVVRPDQYVGVTTYTGKGDGVSNATDVLFDFDPDLCWLKMRSAVGSHYLWDTVRGFGNNGLIPDSNAAEGYQSTYYTISKLNRGFKIIQDNPGNEVNYAGNTYVSWAWKAGGNKNTFNVDDVGYASAAAAGLDGGTITPTGVSVGTKQGFSIIKWSSGSSTGDFTLSHGLGNVPRFIIQKQLDTGNWWVYHPDAMEGNMAKYLQLNSDNAVATNSANMWGASAPTSSLFGVRVGDLIAASKDAITYLWADIPGLQKFGSYTGNGDADGIFVDLGFRPALLIIKRYDSGSSNNWQLTDAKRSPFNVADTILKPDQSAIEGTHADYATDFLSNGFKQRTGHAARNLSGKTYIYAAWAESPMNNLYGGQSNAR